MRAKRPGNCIQRGSIRYPILCIVFFFKIPSRKYRYKGENKRSGASSVKRKRERKSSFTVENSYKRIYRSVGREGRGKVGSYCYMHVEDEMEKRTKEFRYLFFITFFLKFRQDESEIIENDFPSQRLCTSTDVVDDRRDNFYLMLLLSSSLPLSSHVIAE